MKPHPFKRVVADLIDGVILIAIKLVIAGSFIILSDLFKDINYFGNILVVSLWIFYLITITTLFFIYYVFFFHKYGASPGKLFFRIKVVDYDTGGTLTIRQSFLRAVGYLISGFPLYLGIIWIVFDKNGQGWHDKIAKTRMIDLSKNDVQNKSSNMM